MIGRLALLLALLLAVVGQAWSQRPQNLPVPFLSIDSIPHLIVDLRYFGADNFVGRPIEGYHQKSAWLTAPAAQALSQVAATAARDGYGLWVFDAYRPQIAVNHFVRWARELEDSLQKSAYYPRVAKSRLFGEGYIAARSGHSRGSTVDLSLYRLDTGERLDMGSPFDFFDPRSHPQSTLVSAKARANRSKLPRYMEAAGFQGLATEWWHFTLAEEPYPDRYFNFLIWEPQD